MSKITLIILGALVILMGLFALVAPGFAGVTDPIWHAAAKIVVGIVAVVLGIMDKKK
jgi:hypothetical protein